MSVKRTGIGIWLLVAVVLISGCGKQTDNGKGINNGKTVDRKSGKKRRTKEN